MSKSPRIEKRQLIARTQVFRVEQIDLLFANGSRRCYERLRGGERASVLMVPLLDPQTVLLVREYAAGTLDYQLGLPKGRVEADEEPLASANREMKEEIGYGARRLTCLKDMTVAPGYIAHSTHIILAEDLYPEKLEGDEPEPIEVVPWALSELEDLLKREDFTEARSIAALFLTRDVLRARSHPHEAQNSLR